VAKKQNKVKICLWTHVQNEAAIIEKMLASAVDYIDYWVIVDNGSTDGTQDIIKDFFKKHKIEGKLYQSKIGWKGHGINRQHSWEFLENTDHECDYILRIDADEGIEVADDFDWSLIPQQEAWSIIFHSGNHCVPRMWLWKWGLPWFWADDVAHETIHLRKSIDSEETRQPEQARANLPMSFKHIALGGGMTYDNPIKYIQDILKLENQLHERFRDGSDLGKERYHLLYLCKSFNYLGFNINSEHAYKFFPYGKEQLKLFLERGLFYYEKYLETFGSGGDSWFTHIQKGHLLENMGRYEEALSEYITAYNLREDRGEALHKIFLHYYKTENWSKAFFYARRVERLKCPIDHDAWQIHFNAYFENSWELRDAVAVTYERMGSHKNSEKLLQESRDIFQDLYDNGPKDSDNLDRLKANIQYLDDALGKL